MKTLFENQDEKITATYKTIKNVDVDVKVLTVNYEF